MPYTVKVETAEAKIREVEGFSVKFMQNGGDVRGDKSGVPQYSYYIKAPGSWTVREWIDKRFMQCYPGFQVKILDKSYREVTSGQTKLENIR